MNRDERFAKVKTELLLHVKTWDDWYELVETLLARAVETRLLPFVLDSTFIMAAFMRAMKELPDEGDILVLVERTAHVLVYESKEKLGVDLSVLTIDEAVSATSSASRAALARKALQEMDGGEKKVTLH